MWALEGSNQDKGEEVIRGQKHLRSLNLTTWAAGGLLQACVSGSRALPMQPRHRG